MNCQNTDSTLHVPPGTVIYWINVIQYLKRHINVPRAALGLSDHCLVNLKPTYRQKLKAAKPVIRTVKRWTNEAEQDLKACFDL